VSTSPTMPGQAGTLRDTRPRDARQGIPRPANGGLVGVHPQGPPQAKEIRLHGSTNVVDAPITNPVEAAQQRLEAARSSKGVPIKAPAPRPMQAIVSGIGVVDVDGVDRAFAQRCDAPRSIEAPQPTGTGTTSKAPKPDRASSVNQPESAPRYHTDFSDNAGSRTTTQEAAKAKTKNPPSGKSGKAAAAANIEAEVEAIKVQTIDKAISIALAHAKNIRITEHDPEFKAKNIESIEDGFDSYGKQWRPGAGHQRAFAFVRWLLHSRWFAHTRGNGWEFTSLLIGQNRMQQVCTVLECYDTDLELAADKVQLLAGESVLDVAAARMGDVDLPGYVAVKVRGRFVVEGVVRLLASLVNVTRSTRVYCGHAQMERLLGVDKGSVNKAVQSLVRLKLIEVVSKGVPRDPSKPQAAKGKASEYRLVWALPASAEGRRFDRLP
jgi:hypothetical protein